MRIAILSTVQKLALFLLAATLFSSVANASSPRSQVVLITGSFRGLGLNVARELYDKGHTVILSGREIYHAPDWAPPEGSQDGRAMSVEMDMAEDRSIERALGHIHSKFPRLDTVVHNAGIAVLESADSLRRESLLQSTNVNFLGPTHLTQLAMVRMRKQGFGRIIFLSSSSSLLREAGLSAYTATKAAAEAYFETFAYETRDNPEMRDLDVDVSILRLSFVRSNYDPTLVRDGTGPQINGRVEFMQWLRENSPTSHISVARAIEKTMLTHSPPILHNVGLDGKAMNLFSKAPRNVQLFCSKLLMSVVRGYRTLKPTPRTPENE